MSTFICEKCGCVDNSAMNNNYWAATSNNYNLESGDPLFIDFEDEYFNTHRCCSECCKGLKFKNEGYMNTEGWHGRFEKKHWSAYGTREKLLESCAKNKGDFVNADEYFKQQEGS